ncbi:MAG: DnaJ domain-containing protein [Treponema sp.]|jgi:curved DNA-binding protein CbpA|nr:DnaJ domain-containing protein [Treponema sp.]
MDDYYSLLGIGKNASPQEIKKAFRERAKRLHPDIAGKAAEGQMRRILAAYEALSRTDRRFEYDRAFTRFSRTFDYPAFLRERRADPASQAKLIFYLLLHPDNERFAPLKIWEENGGLAFSLEKYLEREDWMDCAFLLAEELDRQGRPYEAFSLLVNITREERRRPYFKHFMEDVEGFLRELTLFRLKYAVDSEQYAYCLESFLALGFPQKEEKRILRALAEALFRLGEADRSEAVRREIAKREARQDPERKHRKKLKVP